MLLLFVIARCSLFVVCWFVGLLYVLVVCCEVCSLFVVTRSVIVLCSCFCLLFIFGCCLLRCVVCCLWFVVCGLFLCCR